MLKNHFLALLPQFLPTGCLLRCAWRLFYQMGQSQYVFSFPRYGHLCAGFFFLCSKKYVASPTVEFCSDNKRISGKQTKILIKIIKKQYKVLTTGGGHLIESIQAGQAWVCWVTLTLVGKTESNLKLCSWGRCRDDEINHNTIQNMLNWIENKC